VLDAVSVLVIGSVELVQLVTTRHYDALANSRTRLLTPAHAKSSMSSLVVAR
jgi:hypothetical protein